MTTAEAKEKKKTNGSNAKRSAASRERILAITNKEWLDLRRNKSVVSAMIMLPMLMTLMACGLLITSSRLGKAASSSSSSSSSIPAHLVGLTSDPHEARIMTMVFTALMFFSVVPAVLPSIMAAHSIVGEKQARSLEPLLATPLRTWELLVGKLMGILLPAVLPSLLGYAIYTVVVWSVAPVAVFHLVISPAFLLTVSVVGPLTAVLAITFGIMVSSRAADLQTAQGISGLLALPVLGIGAGQLFGSVSLSITAVMVKVLILVILDIGMLLLSVSIFERETILSRWK